MQTSSKGVRGKYLGKVDMKRTPTYHEGANDERTAILAKVRRELKSFGKIHDYQGQRSILYQLESWLLQRNERYKKRNGGL